MKEKRLYQKIEKILESKIDIELLKKYSIELLNLQEDENEKMFYCLRILALILENQDKIQWQMIEEYVHQITDLLFKTMATSELQYLYKAGFEEQILIANQESRKRKCYQYLFNCYKQHFDSFVFKKKRSYYKKLAQNV